MEAHGSNDDREGPKWVPYTPPAATGWERVWLFFRRLAFPAVVVFLLVGLASLFYWGDTISRSVRSTLDGGGSSSQIESVENPTSRPSPSETRLTVRSTPPGATVRLNGDSVGVTPLQDRTTRPGSYLLSVRREGHFRADTVLVLGDQRSATVNVALRPRPGYAATAAEGEAPDAAQESPPSERAAPRTQVPSSSAPSRGGLYITSVPGGALVTVDGTQEGRTPVLISELPTGSKQISVSLTGYDAWSTQVSVSEGTTRRVHAELDPESGRLRVLARPWGTIYIDDQLHVREQDVWYETTLPVGEHEVRVVHPILGTERRQVQVPANEEVSIVVDLRSESSEEGRR